VRTALLPLHYGKAPPWLFRRMKALAKGIVSVIVENYGTATLIERLNDPFWFQALGMLLGFDWHSSGLTTTTTAALSSALNEADLGIYMAGGKGKAHTTLSDIEEKAQRLGLNDKGVHTLQHVSRLLAKMANACIQDGHNIYHHTIVFDSRARWVVVQQGMNKEQRTARRYHFYYKLTPLHHNVEISGEQKMNKVLHLANASHAQARKHIVEVVEELRMPSQHLLRYDMLTKKDKEFLARLAEQPPSNFTELLLTPGMGQKKVRALALAARLIFGTELDWRDPLKYAFAHGGKDGTPFPVDKHVYDHTIEFFKEVINNTAHKHYFTQQLKKLAKL